MRIVYRRAAFRELRTAPGVVADLRRRAVNMADACGPGYEALPPQAPRNRAHEVVAAETIPAKLDNARNQTLLRNISAAAR